MKVKETYNNQDGTTTSREIQIPLEKGRSVVCHTLVPTTEEPIGIKIIEAGWYDGGPTFHIITEYGDFYQSDYDFGNLNYVLEKYPEFKSIWEEKFPDVVVSSKELINIPNDQELGKWARKQTVQTETYRQEIINK